MSRWKAVVLGAMFALGACAGHRPPFQPLQADSAVQTVGDEAAVVAHRATDSDLTAAALNATNAFGAPLRSLSDGDPLWSLRSPGPNGVCRDGIEAFAPDRSGDPGSQEVVQYFDRRCSTVARETVATLRGASGSNETIDRTTWIYDRTSTAPIALRESVTIVAHASFAPSGRPIARDGYITTTSTRLSIGSRVQSVTGFEEVALPGGAERCQAAAGYDVAGVPSLDATFGWQSASTDQALPRGNAIGGDRMVVTSNQIGRLFVGPIGSLSIAGGTLQPSCPIGRPAYSLSGGTVSGTFKMAAQAVFHNGRLSSLRVPGASMSGGYRFDAWTDSGAHVTHGERRVRAVLSDDRARVAAIDADRFGDGLMTVTATGEQYRLVDWTVVR
ncbi:MAG TPA: hypothetical protein VGK84_03000 [Candidatus Tumulicola sp.]|jgi:hypothetical protein